MIEEVKQLRIKIDGLSQLVKGLKTISEKFDYVEAGLFRTGTTGRKISSDEINKSYDSLILAKAWLGKILGEVSPFIYKVDLWPELADKSKGGFYIYLNKEKIEIFSSAIEFDSQEQLSYDEVLEKFRNTKGIREVKGNFKSPYTNDGNRKSVEDIEETADVATEENVTKDGRVYEQRNHIEKVDWLREEIKKIVKNSNMKLTCTELCFHNIITHLTEARFWLGFELQRIKETDE